MVENKLIVSLIMLTITTNISLIIMSNYVRRHRTEEEEKEENVQILKLCKL